MTSSLYYYECSHHITEQNMTCNGPVVPYAQHSASTQEIQCNHNEEILDNNSRSKTPSYRKTYNVLSLNKYEIIISIIFIGMPFLPQVNSFFNFLAKCSPEKRIPTRWNLLPNSLLPMAKQLLRGMWDVKLLDLDTLTPTHNNLCWHIFTIFSQEPRTDTFESHVTSYKFVQC